MVISAYSSLTPVAELASDDDDYYEEGYAEGEEGEGEEGGGPDDGMDATERGQSFQGDHCLLADLVQHRWLRHCLSPAHG